MSTEDNELTLEGLAQRLEALERENSELKGKLAVLEGTVPRRDEQPAPRNSDESRSSPWAVTDTIEGRVSRRALLGKAAAVALAATAGGTLLSPREAKADTATFDNIWARTVQVDTALFCGNLATGRAIWGQTTSDGSQAVFGRNYGSGEAVMGENFNVRGPGVRGYGIIGVRGESPVSGQAGVYGQHYSGPGPGVVGDGNGSGYAGVWGRNPDGTGVKGEGSTQAEVAGVRGTGKTGIWGSSAATGYSGVYGQHTGTAGYGVVGDGTGNGAGLLGRNAGGAGVEARDSRHGGKFDGSRAQLLLVPKTATGSPTTGAHTKGEIFMDSAAALFVCVAGGTPGTWRKVQTVAV